MTEAILLVGGLGTRLRPLTQRTPKPLLPVAGVPFVQHQVVRAREAGARRVVLATSYRAADFAETLGDGSRLGVEVRYAVEDEPLGTGGAIRNAADQLAGGPDDPVLVLNGDILDGHDLRAQLAVHADRGADVTLHLTRVEDPRAFGCVPTDAGGRVTAFLEKDPNPVTDQVNAGCYVFRRRVIDTIPAGRVVSVERETFPGLLACGALVVGHVELAYWLDLGTPGAYVRGSADAVLGKVDAPARPGPAGPALVLPGASVAPTALLSGGTSVGARARIGPQAEVTGSVVMAGAAVGAGAVVAASAIGRGAVIGAGCRLDGAVVGDGAVLADGVLLGPDERVGCGERRTR